jgi:hypothetical protein
MAMKNLKIFILLLTVLTVKAQKPQPAQKTEPAYIIDSVYLTAGKLYIDFIGPQQIASINVIKHSVLYPDGAIAITLKDHNILTRLQKDKWLSLNDIAVKNGVNFNKNQPVLYILNDKLLMDTTAIRIPSICIANMSLIRAAETAYFKTVLPDALILMISTKTVDQPAIIWIRGETAGK